LGLQPLTVELFGALLRLALSLGGRIERILVRFRHLTGLLGSCICNILASLPYFALVPISNLVRLTAYFPSVAWDVKDAAIWTVPVRITVARIYLKGAVARVYLKGAIARCIAGALGLTVLRYPRFSPQAVVSGYNYREQSCTQHDRHIPSCHH
jgi:hypothetical protein